MGKHIHGLYSHPLYDRWRAIVARCTNPSRKDYHRYGGRGIRVCERWLSVENFIADVPLPPTPDHQLDRIDNDGDYEPSNVRWVTRKEQVRNRRCTKFLTWLGLNRSVPDWAERVGLPIDTLYHRVARGWSVDRALTEPLHRRAA